MAFSEIDDQARYQATDAIEKAKDRKNLSDRPNADLEFVAAGAALALERGAPNLMTLSYGLPAGDYLLKGSRAWSSLHGALSRVIANETPEDVPFPTDGEMVKQTVSNVLQTSSARQVVMAAGNNDFEPFLNDSQVELVKMSRDNQDFLRQMSFLAVGSYERLSPDMAQSVENALSMPIPGRLGQEVETVGNAVDKLVGRMVDLHESFDNSNDGLHPRFVPVSEESKKKVEEFHRTAFTDNPVSTGDEKLDAAMTILFDQERIPMNYDRNAPIMIAQARLLEEGSSQRVDTPAELVAMAITDAAIMTQAVSRKMENEFEEITSVGSSIVPMSRMTTENLDHAARGNYHEMDPSHQDNIAYALMMGAAVSPVERLRLEVAVAQGEDISIVRSGPERETSQKLTNPGAEMLRNVQMAAAQAGGMGM